MCSPDFNTLLTGFDPLKQDNKFRYNLLDRMISDCKYFLGPGHRNPKFLWTGDIMAHINLMKDLYNSFDTYEKPEWTSMDDIIEYENRMLD